ncbi:MAG: hypothetical protein MZW92_14530 [Comamonadaceae bacterium]|nr:hypothetical protein [Comamonadaceae bacterium]
MPLSELVRVERGVVDKPLYTKDLQGVSYVYGRRRRRRRDARLAAVRPVRHPRASWPTPRCRTPARSASTGSASPTTRTAEYALKWDGEWQITYETFRDMGAAYGVGPGADLPAGGRAVPQLPRRRWSSWRRSR